MVKAIVEGAKKAKKGIEDSVHYAIGHRARVRTLILLNEGEYTATEISRATGVPLSKLYNYLRRMLEEGSTEIASEETKGNMKLLRYRAVEIQCYQQHEFEELTFENRQNIAGAIIQSGTAEVLAGFYDGKLAHPKAFAYWDWFNLDAKGRKDADALQYRYLREMMSIEAESTERSGERTRSMLLQLMFFERPRKGKLREKRI